MSADEILDCDESDVRAAASFYAAMEVHGDYFASKTRRAAEQAAFIASQIPIAEQVRYAYERGRHDALQGVAHDIASAGERMAELRKAGHSGY